MSIGRIRHIESEKRKARIRILLTAGLFLGMFCVGAGCAKDSPADSGVQDIVPENGAGPDGTPVTDAWNGADTTGTQETAQVGKLILTLPKGYSESTTDGLYLNQNYPDDQSNVYIYATEKTTDFEQVMAGGREQFAAFLDDAYEEQYKERPEISMTRYEAVSVGNYPAYAVELSYDLKGVHYVQLEYIVDADKTYYIAFSHVGDSLWMEAFRGSAETMIFSEAE